MKDFFPSQPLTTADSNFRSQQYVELHGEGEGLSDSEGFSDDENIEMIEVEAGIAESSMNQDKPSASTSRPDTPPPTLPKGPTFSFDVRGTYTFCLSYVC